MRTCNSKKFLIKYDLHLIHHKDMYSNIMEIMSYLRYFELVWRYMSYIIYATAFITLLPKSFHKMKAFTNGKRVKYHRCYAPDICCHTLANTSDAELDHEPLTTTNQKHRRIVRRVYPKKKASLNSSDSVLQEHNNQRIKRQVQTSTIQTNTHVNQIAKMFEDGNFGNKVNQYVRNNEHDMDSTEHRNLNLSRLTESTNKENIENQLPLYVSSKTDKNYENEKWTAQFQRSDYLKLSPVYNNDSTTPSKLSPMSLSPIEFNTSDPPSPVIHAQTSWLNMKTSLEDIFASIASNAESDNLNDKTNTLSPVTSIEDILSQRRLSRNLSAYSISELLNDDTINTSAMCHPEEAIYSENFILRPFKTTEWC